MAEQTDNLSHPEPESGKGLHTQESGDAGLSCNMQHNFSDHDKRALPVADNGCHVGPTSQEKSDFFKACEMTGKVWSLPTMFEPSTDPKDKSYLLTAEKGFLKPSPEAALQENNMPSPQAPLIVLPENSVKKEAAEALHKAAEDQPHVEAADDSNIMDTKMEKQTKRPPRGPRKRRNSNYIRKRAAGKKRCLLFLIAVLVPVTKGFAATNCFTCMDEDICPKLRTIYHNDVLVYKGARNQTFEECRKVTPPTIPRNCSVCLDQSNITIICSKDVGAMDLETWDGQTTSNYQPRSCNWTCASTSTTPHRSRYGLIGACALFLVVVAALGISGCCQKSMLGNDKAGMEIVNTEEHCNNKKTTMC